MRVLAGDKRAQGTIVRLDKKKGQDNFWIVETGNLRISFPEKELRMADNGKKSETKSPGIGWAADITAQQDFRIELDLRGMRLEEALAALRRQIDAAVVSGAGEFSVVHGMGDGVLQKGVHEYLKNEAAVADYRFSRPELGGFGRTEVRLG
jgi:DNA mismatch repair protein MutS2